LINISILSCLWITQCCHSKSPTTN